MIRRISFVVSITFLAITSFLFVVFPKIIPGAIMQLMMLLVMGLVFALVFLDRVSFVINKKLYRKDILHDYLFTHSKPEDIHSDLELVQELVASRRQAALDFKRS